MRTVVTAILVFVLVMAAGVGGFVVSSFRLAEAETQSIPDLYEGVPVDARLLQLDKEALDRAYTNHLSRLFDVWLSDQAKDMQRVSNGLRHARRAYGVAAEQITKRQRELEKRP